MGSLTTSIATMHSNFLCDIIDASKLFSYHAYSILPSILFLGSIFVLLYLQFHKHTNSFTRWRTRICKDLLFHWTYFYTSRIWFLFVKVCRWALQHSDKAIEKTSNRHEAYYNKMVTHSCVFLMVLGMSLIPCLILFVKYCSRREIPNFLLWVAEDPWMRSEMGTSGHYLERPPPLRPEIYNPHKRTASYRSGRSSSVDTNVYLEKPYSFLRPCRSAMSIKTSAEDIIG